MHPVHPNLQSFYIEGLARWDTDLFDRGVLKDDILTILCPREQLTTRIEQTLWEIRVAQTLGIHPKVNPKGTSSSVIYLDRNKKPIAIFKQNHRHWIARIRQIIAACFGFSCQNYLSGLPQDQAEVATSLVNDFLQLNIVPLTRDVSINGKTGSLMVWMDRMQEAAKTVFNPAPQEAELLLFQQMVVLDYLIGNSDCHLENWLVQQNQNDKTITQLAKIDNGNAFPSIAPSKGIRDFFARRYMFEWRNHPWAQFSFSEKILNLLQSLSKEKITDLLQHLEQNNITLSEKQKELLKLRATVLKQYAKTSSVANLGTLFSRSDQERAAQSSPTQ